MKNPLYAFTILLIVASCGQNRSANPQSPSAANVAAPLPDGTHCFEHRVGKDVTTVQLTLNGNEVSGEMSWLPFEKDSGTGTLRGLRTEGEIIAVWSYTIEGSNQTEEVRFQLTGDQLQRKTGELVDPANDGNLKLKDPAAAQYTETYTKVACL
jgi:hypothetical protein